MPGTIPGIEDLAVHKTDTNPVSLRSRQTKKQGITETECVRWWQVPCVELGRGCELSLGGQRS